MTKNEESKGMSEFIARDLQGQSAPAPARTPTKNGVRTAYCHAPSCPERLGYWNERKAFCPSEGYRFRPESGIFRKSSRSAARHSEESSRGSFMGGTFPGAAKLAKKVRRQRQHSLNRTYSPWSGNLKMICSQCKRCSVIIQKAEENLCKIEVYPYE